MANPHKTTRKELAWTPHRLKPRRDISVSAPHILSCIEGYDEEFVDKFMTGNSR